MARAEGGITRLRVLSALVLVPPAVAAAWFGWPWLQFLTVLVAAGMGDEWARLAAAGRNRAGAVIVVTLAAATVAMALGWSVLAWSAALLGSVAAGLVALGIRGAVPLWAAFGTLWIALPCLAFLRLAADPETGRTAVLWLLFTVWATDTGAYVAGRSLGGPRLAPRISPNKTWSGLLGGLACAGLMGLAFAHWTGHAVSVLVPVGVALGLAAQLGDLAESIAKRRFGVKDSGSLIPGHGGLLDRLDGMLTAAALQGLLTLAAGASPLVWRS